ncbi:unnamed protein product, partial [Heterosigma akashiwo]
PQAASDQEGGDDKGVKAAAPELDWGSASDDTDSDQEKPKDSAPSSALKRK